MSDPYRSSIREAVRDLNTRYIRALDGKDMAQWLACFDDPGAYYVISAENEAEGLPICLMMDDNRDRLVDRVTYVTRVWAGSYEDYQTRHFVQLVSLDRDGDLHAALSNVVVYNTDLRGRTALLVAGQYRDRIVIDDGVARFRERRMVMDTFTTPGVVVYPL